MAISYGDAGVFSVDGVTTAVDGVLATSFNFPDEDVRGIGGLAIDVDE